MPATVISIVPLPINEFKPGVVPGTFKIPAAVNGEPSILVIGDSVSILWNVIDDPKGTRKIRLPHSSAEMAKSIVDDFINSFIGVGEECHPGLMWKDGSYDLKTAKSKFSSELNYLKIVQDIWFTKLLKMADDDWARYHQHRAISDIQRVAANCLNQDREWAKMGSDVILDKCPGCGSPTNRQYAVCPNCKAILNEEQYKKLKFAV